MNNPKIFISYSHRDKFFVHYLIDELKSTFEHSDDFPIWLDEWSIGAGRKWKPAIDEALDNAFVVLVICSVDSMKSHQVTYEWSYAFSQKIQIIPILYRASLDDIHERLKECNVSIQADTPDNINFLSLIDAISYFKDEYIHKQEIRANHYNLDTITQSLKSDDVGEIITGLRIAQVVADIKFKVDLIPLTQHRVIQVRKMALSALHKIDIDKAIEIVINGFSDSNFKIRKLAKSQAIFHAQYSPQIWFEKLITEIINVDKVVFNSGIPFGRINAIEALKWIIYAESARYGNIEPTKRYYEFVNILIDLTSDENVDVVAASIKALGPFAYNEAENTLLGFVNDTRLGFDEEDDEGNIIRKEISLISKATITRLPITLERRKKQSILNLEDALNAKLKQMRLISNDDE